MSEAKEIVVGPSEADAIWDDGEFLIAVESGYQRLPAMKENGLWFWVPPGRFVWRTEGGTSLDQRMSHLRSLSAASPELMAGFFGNSMEGLNETLPQLTDFFGRAGSRYF